jgi:TPP-dependent trihydroxycyclohexane-1,2-dione (THcHDO) dehydratase
LTSNLVVVCGTAGPGVSHLFNGMIAYPGRQTIALCGDGSFTMLALGDLLTQVQRKTPVVQIVLNNESLDFVKIEQQEAGLVPFGVEFKNPDFAKVAEAMGAKGFRIEEPGDVKEGLVRPLRTRVAPSLSMWLSILSPCRCRRMFPSIQSRGTPLALPGRY